MSKQALTVVSAFFDASSVHPAKFLKPQRFYKKMRCLDCCNVARYVMSIAKKMLSLLVAKALYAIS